MQLLFLRVLYYLRKPQNMENTHLETIQEQSWIIIVVIYLRFLGVFNINMHCHSFFFWNCLCCISKVLVSHFNPRQFSISSLMSLLTHSSPKSVSFWASKMPQQVRAVTTSLISELCPWVPKDRKRKLTPSGYSLTATGIRWHMRPHSEINNCNKTPEKGM